MEAESENLVHVNTLIHPQCPSSKVWPLISQTETPESCLVTTTVFVIGQAAVFAIREAVFAIRQIKAALQCRGNRAGSVFYTRI